jgi:hypothetical protein
MVIDGKQVYFLMNSQPDRIPFSFTASNSTAMSGDRFPMMLVHGENSLFSFGKPQTKIRLTGWFRSTRTFII